MILILDDDTEYAAALAEILCEDVGVDVEICLDGQSALKKLKTVAPAVIILDMMVPMNDDDLEGGQPPQREELPRGMEILERICETGFSPKKILVITALVKLRLVAKLKRFGIPEKNVAFKPAAASRITNAVLRIRAEER